ncbi:MAG: 4a-hydroxytetrahydrobiopterin dehydratase [Gemmatimonadaceae bacterium]|jgi:4a-hydroxytetrahydrobiopterin dehydratase|nr:4a-hydroxytetrahydrobiopterin dehydratase [Gemmatimonadaceae bacterium]
MERLTDAAVSAALTELSGWKRVGDAIVARYACAGFPEAIALVTRIGFLAEAVNHHPDLDIRWRWVHVLLTTHDAGGLTQNDVALAKQIAVAATGMGAEAVALAG